MTPRGSSAGGPGACSEAEVGRFLREVRIEADSVDGDTLIAARDQLEEYSWLHGRSAYLSLALLSRLVAPGSGPRVLELGGAPYFFSALMARHFAAHLTAVNVPAASWPGEPSPVTSGRVRLRVPDDDSATRALDVDVAVFNMEKDPFPFPDEAFDVVLCMEVLEHLGYSPSHMLGEVHRVLRPQGVLLITVPNLLTIKRTISHFFNVPMEFPYSGYGIYGRHQREYAPGEVRRLLEANNYQIAALQTANVWPVHRGSVIKAAGNVVLNAVTRLPLPGLAAKREYILCAARPHGDAVASYPKWLYKHRRMFPDPPPGVRKVLPD